MEGVGSRLGRASSRYGPSSTAAVFNGSVRKWKRKWVHVSPPPSSSNNNNNRHSSSSSSSVVSNSQNNLLLPRWTPLSSSSTDQEEDPPQRKFRYTPVAVLEEQKRAAANKVEVSKSGENRDSVVPTAQTEDTNHEVAKRDDSVVFKQTEESNTALELGLFLKGHSSKQDGEQSEKAQVNQASTGRS